MPAALTSAPRSLPCGSRSSSTMIVMMMASTPSLNASRRLVRIAPGYQGGLQVGDVLVRRGLAALPGQLMHQAVAEQQHGLGLVSADRHGQQVALAVVAAHPDEQFP